MSDKDWLGGHIAVRDVARAVAAAAAYAIGPAIDVPFEAFFLSARDTFHTVPTVSILESVFDEPPPIRDSAYFEVNPYASVFDIRKAERLLGWKPAYHWREFDQWEL